MSEANGGGDDLSTCQVPAQSKQGKYETLRLVTVFVPRNSSIGEAYPTFFALEDRHRQRFVADPNISLEPPQSVPQVMR